MRNANLVFGDTWWWVSKTTMLKANGGEGKDLVLQNTKS